MALLSVLQRYNRRRRQLDNHPAYALAAKLGERLAKETEVKIDPHLIVVDQADYGFLTGRQVVPCPSPG